MNHIKNSDSGAAPGMEGRHRWRAAQLETTAGHFHATASDDHSGSLIIHSESPWTVSIDSMEGIMIQVSNEINIPVGRTAISFAASESSILISCILSESCNSENMSIARERAAWGVCIPRAFSREEKKLWTKEEKGMYKAFELHGKDQALKLMRAYFARKRNEGGDEESIERGVSMTCSLLHFRQGSVDKCGPSDAAENIFGEEEQKLFKQALTSIDGLEELDESAIAITKIDDPSDPKEDSKRLCVTFEITTSDGIGDGEGKSALSAADLASKLNDAKSFISSLAKKKFTEVEIIHPAEVIGGPKAAKKARKSMMDQMYGDSSHKSGASEAEKHEEED